MRRALFAFLFLLSAPARADERAVVRMEYERGPGAEACPDKVGLQRAVAARVGYFPFSTSAATTLRVEVRREGRRLASSLVMVDVDGQPIGTRELSFVGEDCEAMRDALELAIAIAIDPHVLTRPRAAFLDVPPLPAAALLDAAPSSPASSARPPSSDGPSSTSAAAPAAPAAATAADALPEPPSPGLTWGLSAVLAPAVGATPGPSLGLVLGAQAGLGFFSLAAEATTTTALALRLPDGGEIQGDVQYIGLAPCLRIGWGAACALAQAGVLRLSSQGFTDDVSDAVPFLAAGGRLALDVPLALGPLAQEGVAPLLAPLALRLQLDVTTPLLTVRVLDDLQRPYWSSAPVLGSVGAGVVARFP